MFNAADTPPPSSGRRGALIGGLVVVLLAAAVVLVLWRPSLVGLGPEKPPTEMQQSPARPAAPPPVTSDTPDKDQLAVLETTAGRIVIEFLPQHAPRHTVAFQNMLRASFFDGTHFHRVVPKRFVQGGSPTTKDDNPYDDGLVQEWQRRIPAEISPRLRHTRGMVSAAHALDDIDSATSQFFILATAEPSLDGKFTIFGRVVDGMDVVDKMVAAPLKTDDPKLRERPADPVRITSAYLAPRETAVPQNRKR